MKIITGMHRSGTSFACQLLYEAGGKFCQEKDMLKTDKWNKGGYYESKKVVMMNDKLILGSCLLPKAFRDLPEHERPLYSKILMSIAKIRYLLKFDGKTINKRGIKNNQKISQIVSNLDCAYLKDPRFTLTLDIWSEHMDINDVLLVYRNPYEVALSIKKREGLPVQLGLNLWNRHMQNFLDMAHRYNVTYLNFNHFFDKKRKEKAISKCVQFTGACDQRAFVKAYEKVVNREYLNNSVSKLKLPKNIAETWSFLESNEEKTL